MRLVETRRSSFGAIQVNCAAVLALRWCGRCAQRAMLLLDQTRPHSGPVAGNHHQDRTLDVVPVLACGALSDHRGELLANPDA